MRKVICPYCSGEAVLTKGASLYGSLNPMSKRNFWVCWRCDARVGTHPTDDAHGQDGTVPLGVLANKELRERRVEAHNAFDILWKKGKLSRAAAYAFLASRLGISKEDCHIGLFDEKMCDKVLLSMRDLSKLLK